MLIPWERIEKDYADLFPSNTGTVAKPLRMALGSLIIKERCGFTDRETVEQITENPYLQYFIGLGKYQIEPPFDPSLMVFFRKRLDQDIIKKINEMICHQGKPKHTKHKKPKGKDPGAPPGGSGQAEEHRETQSEDKDPGTAQSVTATIQKQSWQTRSIAAEVTLLSAQGTWHPVEWPRLSDVRLSIPGKKRESNDWI